MLLVACGGYVSLLAYAPELCQFSPIVCPAQRLLGLNCATCGMTRAMACLLRLDPVGAVACNPLVVLFGPLAALWAIDEVLYVFNCRGVLSRVPHRLSRVFWLFLFVALVGVCVVRVASWLDPTINREGWLMPPEEFPPSRHEPQPTDATDCPPMTRGMVHRLAEEGAHAFTVDS